MTDPHIQAVDAALAYLERRNATHKPGPPLVGRDLLLFSLRPQAGRILVRPAADQEPAGTNPNPNQ
jgi:hypothetical protein